MDTNPYKLSGSKSTKATLFKYVSNNYGARLVELRREVD